MLRAALIAVALLSPTMALADGVYLDRNFTDSPSHSSSGKRVRSQRIAPSSVHASTPKAKSVTTKDPWGSSSSRSSRSSW